MSIVTALALTTAVLVASLAVLGRAAVPRAERARLRCLGLVDLVAVTAIGARQAVDALGYAHERRTTWL